MNEKRLEERLARYRPVGPPQDLRDRAVRSAHTRTPWTAIAALLFITLALRILASAEHVALFERLSNASAREILVRELADRLDGDPIAYETARTLIESSDPDLRR